MLVFQIIFFRSGKSHRVLFLQAHFLSTTTDHASCGHHSLWFLLLFLILTFGNEDCLVCRYRQLTNILAFIFQYNAIPKPIPTYIALRLCFSFKRSFIGIIKKTYVAKVAWFMPRTRWYINLFEFFLH